MMSKLSKTSLGSVENAKALAYRAEKVVPAYKKFISNKKYNDTNDFGSRPLTDKKNYIVLSKFSELLSDDYENTFSIFSSSGSSGKSYYWPQLKESHRNSKTLLRKFLQESFSVDTKKTMAIIGLSLGSWIGGDHFSWILKSMAIEMPYPFAVFSPGNNYEEIIRMIQYSASFSDQIILFVCPSAISHLHLKAEEKGIELPFSKIRYVVIGEPFPENLRQSLKQKTKINTNCNFMLSIYGSADTGTLGFESAATVAIRQYLSQNEDIRESLGISLPLPHFFHFIAADTFLEIVENELCVTKWQGIPLIRYNLHDKADIFSFKDIKRVIFSAKTIDPINSELALIIQNANENLPDIIAISGRSDASLIICGTNITEFMLDEVMHCSQLKALITGEYKARITYYNYRQFLELDIELQRGILNSDETENNIYKEIVNSLGRVQPEFLEDWKNIYSAWDNEKSKRVLRINLKNWPSLSNSAETRIKSRGIDNQ